MDIEMHGLATRKQRAVDEGKITVSVAAEDMGRLVGSVYA
jgi:hypothetical protein